MNIDKLYAVFAIFVFVGAGGMLVWAVDNTNESKKALLRLNEASEACANACLPHVHQIIDSECYCANHDMSWRWVYDPEHPETIGEARAREAREAAQ